MRRTIHLIAISIALAAAAACSRASARQSYAPPAAPADTVAAMRQKWEQKGPDSYYYIYQAHCFCYLRDEVEVEVRDGRIAMARRRESREVVAETFWLMIPTVDQLFEKIEEARRAGEPVEARYDPELGYPTEATIGTLANDAGIRHTLRALHPLD